MLYLSEGGIDADFSPEDLTAFTHDALSRIGVRKKVLLLPPDLTRYHSRAGIITKAAFDYYRTAVTDIMPAIGTHQAMTPDEIKLMFPEIPLALFRKHNWLGDLKTLGRVPADFISQSAGFKVDFDWPAQVNRLLVDNAHDLILSIGQVVPHEVVGMANHNKNLFIGTSGAEAINKSHYLGALYGMERIMGHTDSPVRDLLNYASDNFGSSLPVIYIQTVVAADKDGISRVRGIFIGDDNECFKKAAELSRQVNINRLEKRIKRIVVDLPAESNKSLWLGNKAIYRSRMAIEDNGELFIIAPGISRFGEDLRIDAMIRKYGYFGTDAIIEAVRQNEDLRDNLSAAAHLIHGSSEGRFRINYAAGKISAADIESVGYNRLDLDSAKQLFSPDKKLPGFNIDADGEEFYLIKNAAIGLWSAEELK